jgi:transposase-like protein
MTGTIDRVEVITSVQRRRRWSAEEKAAIVQETDLLGMSVSLVAQQHGVAPNQVFKWRQLYADGALSAVGGRGEGGGGLPIPRPATPRCASCSGCWAKRLLRTRSCARRWNWPSQKTAVARAIAGSGRHAVKTICDALGVARSNLIARAAPKSTRQSRCR